ncbi:hypothetical protein TNCV_2862871 [Trichonephila clavipes]|nr:hypothetical protein TNCV_2862871 [Trichonephila clavipes]
MLKPLLINESLRPRALRERSQSHDDIDELLVDDALSDNDIIDLTLDLTVDGVVGLEGDNDEEEKSTPLTGKLIQEGLQLRSKLENNFLINDPNSKRASELQRSATQKENEGCENPWSLPQISIAETVSSDDEGDLEPLRKRRKPLYTGLKKLRYNRVFVSNLQMNECRNKKFGGYVH